MLLSPAAQFLGLALRLKQRLTAKPFTSLESIAIFHIMEKARDLEALVFYVPHLSFTMDMDAKMATQKDNFNLIDYRLNDAELEQFEVWHEAETLTLTDVFNKLAEKSYKVSLTYVENSQAWCVSITGQKEAKFNAATTLTTWADEPLEGLYMAYFKAIVIFNNGAWKTKTQSRRG